MNTINRKSILINGASGGVGTALLQLGKLANLEMYGTCSSRSAPAVTELGGTPIDYNSQDFVKEIHRLTSDGVDTVFEFGSWFHRKISTPCECALTNRAKILVVSSI